MLPSFTDVNCNLKYLHCRGVDANKEMGVMLSVSDLQRSDILTVESLLISPCYSEDNITWNSDN